MSEERELDPKLNKIDADALAARYLALGKKQQLTLLSFLGPSRFAHSFRPASSGVKAAIAESMRSWDADVFLDPLVESSHPFEDEDCYRCLLAALIDALETKRCMPLASIDRRP